MAQDEEVCCAICQEQITHNCAAINCCPHLFCYPCIHAWSKINNTCPLCKQRFSVIKHCSEDGKSISYAVKDVDQFFHDDYHPEEEDEDWRCSVCKSRENEEVLLICDLCQTYTHMYCLTPALSEVPEGDWFCPACTKDQLLSLIPPQPAMVPQPCVDIKPVITPCPQQHGTVLQESKISDQAENGLPLLELVASSQDGIFATKRTQIPRMINSIDFITPTLCRLHCSLPSTQMDGSTVRRSKRKRCIQGHRFASPSQTPTAFSPSSPARSSPIIQPRALKNEEISRRTRHRHSGQAAVRRRRGFRAFVREETRTRMHELKQQQKLIESEMAGLQAKIDEQKFTRTSRFNKLDSIVQQMKQQQKDCVISQTAPIAQISDSHTSTNSIALSSTPLPSHTPTIAPFKPGCLVTHKRVTACTLDNTIPNILQHILPTTAQRSITNGPANSKHSTRKQHTKPIAASPNSTPVVTTPLRNSFLVHSGTEADGSESDDQGQYGPPQLLGTLTKRQVAIANIYNSYSNDTPSVPVKPLPNTFLAPSAKSHSPSISRQSSLKDAVEYEFGPQVIVSNDNHKEALKNTKSITRTSITHSNQRHKKSSQENTDRIRTPCANHKSPLTKRVKAPEREAYKKEGKRKIFTVIKEILKPQAARNHLHSHEVQTISNSLSTKVYNSWKTTVSELVPGNFQDIDDFLSAHRKAKISSSVEKYIKSCLRKKAH